MSKRNMAAGVLLAAAGLLSACSGADSSGGGAQDESKQPNPSEQQAASGNQVDSPKDVSGVSPCDFLPKKTADSFGFDPNGESGTSMTTGSDMCSWGGYDSGGSIDMAIIEDRLIHSYVDNQGKYSDFAEVDIKGYPAVRANELKPEESGTCDFFMAINENQVVSSQVNMVESAGADPCGMAKQALEESIPNMPAAK